MLFYNTYQSNFLSCLKRLTFDQLVAHIEKMFHYKRECVNVVKINNKN